MWSYGIRFCRQSEMIGHAVVLFAPPARAGGLSLNQNTGYWAGVYGSYDQTAQQISNAVGASNVTIWTFDLSIQGCVTNTPFPTPAPDVAYSVAKSLQYALGCDIFNGVVSIKNVDLDSSYFTDPSSNPTPGLRGF